VFILAIFCCCVPVVVFRRCSRGCYLCSKHCGFVT